MARHRQPRRRDGLRFEALDWPDIRRQAHALGTDHIRRHTGLRIDQHVLGLWLRLDLGKPTSVEHMHFFVAVGEDDLDVV